MKIEAVNHIYFVGIGGIGMSALARYFLRAGKRISGYDRASTQLTKTLESEGMNIHYIDDVCLVPKDIDMVIYTPAIPGDNTEFIHFQNSELPLFKRSEVLGMISKEKKTIAIAGTHGKTTTCSIVSYLLHHSGIDVSAFVGGIMKNFGSNYLYGESDWVVVEADEFDRSFLKLHPDIAVVLSMDADHLDIYGTKDSVQDGFREFTMNIKNGGSLWMHHSLLTLITDSWQEVLDDKSISVHSFGIENGEVQARNINVDNGKFCYDVQVNEIVNGFELGLGGRHNVSNAVVATAVSKQLGCTWEDLRQAINSFRGIKRRFELVASTSDSVLIDDYAHHPSELKAAISAVRELYPDRHLTVVFQPHLYSRTRDFVDGFAKELSKADRLILTEIYPARELAIPGVTSSIIFDKVTLEDKYLIHQDELLGSLEGISLNLLLVAGAGDIDKKVNEINSRFFNA